MILRVFCCFLIQIVGPNAAAAAAAPVVLTNSRRSIPFFLVMDLPSVHSERRLAAKRDCFAASRERARQNVYITLSATWVASRLNVAPPTVGRHVVFALSSSSPSA